MNGDEDEDSEDATIDQGLMDEYDALIASMEDGDMDSDEDEDSDEDSEDLDAEYDALIAEIEGGIDLSEDWDDEFDRIADELLSSGIETDENDEEDGNENGDDVLFVGTLIGFTKLNTGYSFMMVSPDGSYYTGSWTGVPFDTKSFDDVEKVIRYIPGEVELVEEPDLLLTPDSIPFENVRPERIPFSMWEEVEMTSEEFSTRWIEDAKDKSLVVGSRIDPVGQRWVLKAIPVKPIRS